VAKEIPAHRALSPATVMSLDEAWNGVCDLEAGTGDRT
jgi:hypothetical protein